MLFWRRNKRQEDVAAENEENLYPVVHVMNTLKEYEKEMVQKEVDSLWELNENEPGQSLWRHKDETQEVSRSHSSVY